MAMAGMRLDIVKLFKLLGDHCREAGAGRRHSHTGCTCCYCISAICGCIHHRVPICSKWLLEFGTWRFNRRSHYNTSTHTTQSAQSTSTFSHRAGKVFNNVRVHWLAPLLRESGQLETRAASRNARLFILHSTCVIL